MCVQDWKKIFLTKGEGPEGWESGKKYGEEGPGFWKFFLKVMKIDVERFPEFLPLVLLLSFSLLSLPFGSFLFFSHATTNSLHCILPP